MPHYSGKEKCTPSGQEGYTVWHENFMVVKFYGLPLNRLDEKLLGF